MSKPKGWSKKQLKKRDQLAKKLNGNYALATWIIKNKKKRRRKK